MESFSVFVCLIIYNYCSKVGYVNKDFEKRLILFANVCRPYQLCPDAPPPPPPPPKEGNKLDSFPIYKITPIKIVKNEKSAFYVSPRRGIRFVFAPVSDRSLSLSQSVISYLLFGITRPLLERE